MHSKVASLDPMRGIVVKSSVLCLLQGFPVADREQLIATKRKITRLANLKLIAALTFEEPNDNMDS